VLSGLRMLGLSGEIEKRLAWGQVLGHGMNKMFWHVPCARCQQPLPSWGGSTPVGRGVDDSHQLQAEESAYQPYNY